MSRKVRWNLSKNLDGWHENAARPIHILCTSWNADVPLNRYHMLCRRGISWGLENGGQPCLGLDYAYNQWEVWTCLREGSSFFLWVGWGRIFLTLVFPYVLNDVPQVLNGFSMMLPKFLMCTPRVFLIAPHSIPWSFAQKSFPSLPIWLSQRAGNLTAVRPSQVSVYFWWWGIKMAHCQKIKRELGKQAI